MDPHIIGLLEPVIVLGSLMGLALCGKLLIWGRGPLRLPRGTRHDPALEHRVAELEARLQHAADVNAEQADLLDDLVERLDFAERMLTRQNAEEPKALEDPAVSTPV